MERITRTKMEILLFIKIMILLFLMQIKMKKLTDEQLQEIANKINKGVEDGRAED